MFCFTFVSDHNTDKLMLYSVQLKTMYSYLNSFLKLSDIVRGLLSTTVLQLIIIIQTHHHHSFYFILQFFTFYIHIMFSLNTV